MIKQLLGTTVLLVLLFSVPTISTAQNFGIELGGSYNSQNGSFRAPCGCIFPGDGKGAGFVAGILYDFISVGSFTIGVEPGFDLQTYTAWEVPSNPLSGDQINVQMRYITFAPYVRYQVHGSGLFFQVAPEAGYLVSNSYQHISHPTSVPAEDVDSSMGDLRTMRYAARASVGYKFELFGLKVAPMFTLDFPLNNIRADAPLDPTTDIGIHGASGWHITSIYLSFVAFFKS